MSSMAAGNETFATFAFCLVDIAVALRTPARICGPGVSYLRMSYLVAVIITGTVLQDRLKASYA